jgi:hypothetical protein
MPKLLQARVPRDDAEERVVRKLAASRHAPGDWIKRAKMIALSWDGWRTTAIAAELDCHPQTVRERIDRFNAEGVDGLGARPGAGRKPRLMETERSQIRRILRAEGVRWRTTRSWAASSDPAFVPKGQRSSRST